MEKQFRRYYAEAASRPGRTGETLPQILESRLDNVVYRVGLARTRSASRKLVTHGHFLVNGTRTDIPSVLLRPGDRIEVREGSRKTTFFKELPDYAEKRNCAVWLDRDVKSLSGQVVRLPERSEIDGSLNEQLIVEFYSR